MFRLLLLVALGLWPAAFDQAPKVDTRASTVVAKAAAYVAQYQKAFAFLLADEKYEQVRRSGPTESPVTDRRAISAEAFLTYVVASDTWIFVRDVKTVDGHPVVAPQNAQALLQDRTSSDTLRRIKDLNSRYNLGRITRNFNEPTLALLVVGPAHRPQFKFKTTSVTRDGDATLVTIAFRETDRPTLIRDASGASIFTTGELVVEAETGVIRATRLSMKDGTIGAAMSTRYERDPKLEMWLPTMFAEHYEQSLKAVREQIDCEARYTDYRRFEVTGRIK